MRFNSLSFARAMSAIIINRLKIHIEPNKLNNNVFGSILFSQIRDRRHHENVDQDPKANIITPSCFPSKDNTMLGINFNVSNINRKYHSGFIPAGAGAKRSAFMPNSFGKNKARITKPENTNRPLTASYSRKSG